jgi:hypothetical protein
MAPEKAAPAGNGDYVVEGQGALLPDVGRNSA